MQTLPAKRIPAAPTGPVDPRRVTAIAITVALHVAAGLMLALPNALPFQPPVPPQDVPIEWVVVEPIPVQSTLPAPPMPQAPTRPPEPLPTLQPTPMTVPQVPTVQRSALPVAPVRPSLTIASYSPVRQVAEPSLAQLDYRERPPLPYPGMALRRGWEGEVLLRLEVDVRGVPQRAEIRRSSGHRELDRAAERYALQKLRFHPARIDGRAVPARADIPVRFTLPR